jgi:hypothetical protein
MALVVVRVPWVGSSGTHLSFSPCYLPLGHVNQLRKGVVSVGCAHNYYYYSGTSYGLKYVTKYRVLLRANPCTCTHNLHCSTQCAIIDVQKLLIGLIIEIAVVSPSCMHDAVTN